MLKKIAALTLISVLVIITAGCIVEQPDRIIGTWVAEDYTNTAGMHYTSITDTFNDGNTGYEIGNIDDGSLTNWNFLWINRGDYYEVFYSPLNLQINNDYTSGTINSGSTEVDEWVFTRTEGSGTNIIGKWETESQYPYEGQMFYINVVIEPEGIGVVSFKNDLMNLDIDLEWSKLTDNSYVIAISHTMIFKIDDKGVMTDNFGYKYYKV